MRSAPQQSCVLGLRIIVVLGVLGLGAAAAKAQPTAHYVPGSEGIKAATLPPPGWYLRDYNLFYTSDRVNDSSGDKIAGANLDTFVYAQVPRLLWITEVQFLDGNLGFDALVPIISQDVKVNTPAGPFDESKFNIGDPFVEATMSWHLEQFDVAAAIGEWMPAGPSAAPPTAQPGLGYWTTMFTLGATWYPDAEKTWALSLLNRYEINSESRDTHITKGDAWTAEWGVSKTLGKFWDVGLVGYYQQQVNGDRGTPALGRVAAVGPEVSVVCPDIGLITSLRYNYEFWAENRAQGHTITLTFTFRF